MHMQAAEAFLHVYCKGKALQCCWLTWSGGFAGQLHEGPHSLVAGGTQSQYHEPSGTGKHTALQQTVQLYAIWNLNCVLHCTGGMVGESNNRCVAELEGIHSAAASTCFKILTMQVANVAATPE